MHRTRGSYSQTAAGQCECGGGLKFTGFVDYFVTGVGNKVVESIDMKVACIKCGLLYDPDHARFAGDYNEVKDRLTRGMILSR